MKKRNLLFAFAMIASLAGCTGGTSTTASSSADSTLSSVSKAEPESSAEPTMPDAPDQASSSNRTADSSKQAQDAEGTVVVSYSWPVTGMGTTDTDTSASIVLENGNLEGNTAWTAGLIADELGADQIFLEAADAYPVDYDELVDQAKNEQNEGYHPELKEIPDLSKYSTVILVTPNWWADLPMPLYTFLENEDWNGKTIVPVVVHGGSGFSGILDTLSTYADTDEDNALSISRSSLIESEQMIRDWAKEL